MVPVLGKQERPKMVLRGIRRRPWSMQALWQEDGIFPHATDASKPVSLLDGFRIEQRVLRGYRD